MKKIIESLVVLVLLVILIYCVGMKLAPFYYNRGVDYYEKGLYEEAAAFFKRSLKFNPLSMVTNYMLANSYKEKNMPDEAIEEYKRIIKIDPDYIQAYLAVAHIYWGKQMYPEALNHLKQAEKIAPLNQKVKDLLNSVSFEYAADCLNKGTDAFLAQDLPNARTLLNKALEIKPDFAYAYYMSAYFYFSEHNYNEAEKRLNHAIQLDHKLWTAYKLLAEVYSQAGDYEKAVVQYKLALSLNYNNASLHNDLSLALMQMERYQEALAYIKKAARIAPDNLDIRYSLASIYRDNGMFNEAISEYNKLAGAQPDHPNLYNDLGDIYKRQGKKEEALEAYNKQVSCLKPRLLDNPDNAELLNNLAHALNGIGDYHKAKEVIEKALSLQPNYAQGYLTLSKIYENLGSNKESLSALNNAKPLVGRPLSFIEKSAILLESTPERGILSHTIYLKNGRKISGRIKEESEEKVVLEVQLGNVIGSITFYRDTIEKIYQISADSPR